MPFEEPFEYDKPFRYDFQLSYPNCLPNASLISNFSKYYHISTLLTCSPHKKNDCALQAAFFVIFTELAFRPNQSMSVCLGMWKVVPLCSPGSKTSRDLDSRCCGLWLWLLTVLCLFWLIIADYIIKLKPVGPFEKISKKYILIVKKSQVLL